MHVKAFPSTDLTQEDFDLILHQITTTKTGIHMHYADSQAEYTYRLFCRELDYVFRGDRSSYFEHMMSVGEARRDYLAFGQF